MVARYQRRPFLDHFSMKKSKKAKNLKKTKIRKIPKVFKTPPKGFEKVPWGPLMDLYALERKISQFWRSYDLFSEKFDPAWPKKGQKRGSKTGPARRWYPTVGPQGSTDPTFKKEQKTCFLALSGCEESFALGPDRFWKIFLKKFWVSKKLSIKH